MKAPERVSRLCLGYREICPQLFPSTFSADMAGYANVITTQLSRIPVVTHGTRKIGPVKVPFEPEIQKLYGTST